MAVLHLQFDIDSEVHPELHDMLCSIGNRLSREERIRQLAATGLVWERLRLEGAAADASRLQGPAGDAGAPLALEHPEGRPEGVDLADPGNWVLPEIAGDGPSLDLAGEPVAMLAPPAGEQTPPEAFELEMRSAVQDLPVLTDIVDPAEVSALGAAASMRQAAPPDTGLGAGRPGAAFARSGQAIRPLVQVVDHVAVDIRGARSGEAGDNGLGANDPMADPPIASRAAPRSRLMRMKDKGLFKNE